MSKSISIVPKCIEDRIISYVGEKQPVFMGEIFKTLRLSHKKGLNYIISMINQGKLSYDAHNQVQL